MSLRDRQVWDELAEEFDKKVGDAGDQVRRDCVDPMLLNAMGDVCAKGARVLDAGSGNGHLMEKLGRAGYIAEGLDVSPVLLQLARARRPGRVFYEADLEDARSLPTAEWDAVVCSFVLDGLENLDAAASNLHQLTKPDGHLIVNVPHPAFVHPEYWGLRSRKLYIEDDPIGSDVLLFGCTRPAKFFYRPISHYLNALVAAGLSIASLIEPDPRTLDVYFHHTRRPLLHAYMLGIVAKRTR